MSQLSKWAASAVIGSVAVFALGGLPFAQTTAPADKSVPFKSTMANPYRLVENWPKLGTIPPGPAIGIIPDEKGGVWLLHRSDPPLLHIDAAGNVVQKMAEGMSNRGIAMRLHISRYTVKFHVAAILGKLGATSRTEAVTLGVRHGLISL